jgi:GDPmannose 4,6-dehydratase
LAAARIAQGMQECLYLGNLDSLRDWGYAKDYVECMWLILQHETPEDFVIATGVQHTVREFATLAFHHAGIKLRWEGKGVDEKGIVEKILSDKVQSIKEGDVVVQVSPDFYRPTDVVNLLGDPGKAKRELGWNPQTTSFEQLVELMVRHDMQKVTREHFNAAEYLEKGIVK